MTVIDWLLKSNISVKYLVKRDLLDVPEDELRDLRARTLKRGFGLVLMKKQDPQTYMWEGFYSPKYISTHYTLFQLCQLGAPMDDPRIKKAILVLFDHMWKPKGLIDLNRYQDLCVVAMMIRIAAEANLPDARVLDMIDYVLLNQLKDGGWNCEWQENPRQSSLHTTLSVIEAFSKLRKSDLTYRLKDIERAIPPGIEYILTKRLFRSARTGEIIHKDMLNFDFPYSWRYDLLRVLEVLAELRFPYDMRMAEGLDIIVERLDYYGRIKAERRPKGKQHQRYTRTGRFCPFNTQRVFKVLKFYDPKRYACYIQRRLDRSVA
jgi:hypothetical protein